MRELVLSNLNSLARTFQQRTIRFTIVIPIEALGSTQPPTTIKFDHPLPGRDILIR